MVEAGAAADLPKILNITVPQVGHLPLMALRPFFIVSSTPFAISRLALHLTQYPSAIKTFTVRASCPNDDKSLTKPYPKGKPGKADLQAIENKLFMPEMTGLCPILRPFGQNRVLRWIMLVVRADYTYSQPIERGPLPF